VRDRIVQRYVAVDDCGNVINPMIVDGQLHRGIAQGIAQALFEEVQYDGESGQLLTGTIHLGAS
jgi:carbon-monoxide dehydrogenase large subunit